MFSHIIHKVSAKRFPLMWLNTGLFWKKKHENMHYLRFIFIPKTGLNSLKKVSILLCAGPDF